MIEPNEKVDDILQHYGVKGMRWGVSRRGNTGQGGKDRVGSNYTKKQLRADRKALNEKVKSGEMTKREAMNARADNIHKYRVENNTAYRKSIERSARKGRSDKLARKMAQNGMEIRADFTADMVSAAVTRGKDYMGAR